MKRTMRGGRRLALVSITAVLTSLGAVPALADEGPLVTPTTTVDAAITTTTTVDEVSDTATTTMDEVSDTATTTMDEVSDAAATTVDTVSNSASGAAGSITSAASDAEGSIAASTENLTDALTDDTADGTWIGDAESDTGSATIGSTDPAGGSSSHMGTSSDSTQEASPLRSGGERTLLTLADGEGRPHWAVQDTAPCPDAGGPRCSPTSGAGEKDSLAETISEVIGLLALTGFLLLPWIAAVLALTVLGSVALERARATGSRARVSAA
jgi:hypothetical protein